MKKLALTLVMLGLGGCNRAPKTLEQCLNTALQKSDAESMRVAQGICQQMFAGRPGGQPGRPGPGAMTGMGGPGGQPGQPGMMGGPGMPPPMGGGGGGPTMVMPQQGEYFYVTSLARCATLHVQPNGSLAEGKTGFCGPGSRFEVRPGVGLGLTCQNFNQRPEPRTFDAVLDNGRLLIKGVAQNTDLELFRGAQACETSITPEQKEAAKKIAERQQQQKAAPAK